ncbi:MAG: EamA family transporter RarD [Clostridia bacterium]|nr:EamA family transporter RarD [Clostridia bacterium]
MNKSTISVTASYLLWGILPIFWKLLAGVDSFYVLCSRIIWSLVVSVIAVLALGKWKETKEALRNKSVSLRLFACGALVSFNWGAFIWCVMNGRVLDCSLAYYINPIMAIVIGFIAFGEKMNTMRWVSVGLAVVGVAYPAFVNGQVPILAVLIALSFALYGTVKKKVDLPGEVTTFIETLFVMPFALALVIYMEVQGTGALAAGLLPGWRFLLLPAAGLVTYLPLLLYSHGIRRTPMSLAGILMYISPTMQFVIGVVLFHEELSESMLITFGFVLVAVVVFILSGRKPSLRKQEIKVGDS